MRRELDLAASLIGRPQVIFLDEPTTGLDRAKREDVWNTIRGADRRGRVEGLRGEIAIPRQPVGGELRKEIRIMLGRFRELARGATHAQVGTL
jgi:hypothetical protein